MDFADKVVFITGASSGIGWGSPKSSPADEHASESSHAGKTDYANCAR